MVVWQELVQKTLVSVDYVKLVQTSVSVWCSIFGRCLTTRWTTQQQHTTRSQQITRFHIHPKTGIFWCPKFQILFFHRLRRPPWPVVDDLQGSEDEAVITAAITSCSHQWLTAGSCIILFGGVLKGPPPPSNRESFQDNSKTRCAGTCSQSSQLFCLHGAPP